MTLPGRLVDSGKTLPLYRFLQNQPFLHLLLMLISLRKLRRPSPGKALFAGALGGLAGGIAKAAAEVPYPPRVLGQASPTVLLAERIIEQPLSPRQERLIERAVHFAFSAGIGALYGLVTEYWPPVTAAGGGA